MSSHAIVHAVAITEVDFLNGAAPVEVQLLAKGRGRKAKLLCKGRVFKGKVKKSTNAQGGDLTTWYFSGQVRQVEVGDREFRCQLNVTVKLDTHSSLRFPSASLSFKPRPKPSKSSGSLGWQLQKRLPIKLGRQQKLASLRVHGYLTIIGSKSWTSAADSDMIGNSPDALGGSSADTHHDRFSGSLGLPSDSDGAHSSDQYIADILPVENVQVGVIEALRKVGMVGQDGVEDFGQSVQQLAALRGDQKKDEIKQLLTWGKEAQLQKSQYQQEIVLCAAVELLSRPRAKAKIEEIWYKIRKREENKLFFLSPDMRITSPLPQRILSKVPKGSYHRIVAASDADDASIDLQTLPSPVPLGFSVRIKGPPLTEEKLEALSEGHQQRLREIISEISETGLEVRSPLAQRCCERLLSLLENVDFDRVQCKSQWIKLQQIAAKLQENDRQVGLMLEDAGVEQLALRDEEVGERGEHRIMPAIRTESGLIKDLSLAALFLLREKPDGVTGHDVVMKIEQDQHLRRATSASVTMPSSTRFPKMEGWASAVRAGLSKYTVDTGAVRGTHREKLRRLKADMYEEAEAAIHRFRTFEPSKATRVWQILLTHYKRQTVEKICQDSPEAKAWLSSEGTPEDCANKFLEEARRIEDMQEGSTAKRQRLLENV